MRENKVKPQMSLDNQSDQTELEVNFYFSSRPSMDPPNKPEGGQPTCFKHNKSQVKKYQFSSRFPYQDIYTQDEFNKQQQEYMDFTKQQLLLARNEDQRRRNEESETQENHHLHHHPLTNTQRKFINFLYLYAILIVALFASYAFYHFFILKLVDQLDLRQQHESLVSAAKLINQPGNHETTTASPIETTTTTKIDVVHDRELELKMRLLERSIELLAQDLEETKVRLKEREKCDCPQSCSFNNTRYAEGSSWQHQCDTCTCLAGRISCTNRKCPLLDCDEQIQLPNSCCPTCLRKCKFNGTFIKHGQRIVVNSLPGGKECRCMNGRIKCELNSNRKQRETNQRRINGKSQITTENSETAGAEEVGKQLIVNSTGTAIPTTRATLLEVIKQPPVVDWPLKEQKDSHE